MEGFESRIPDILLIDTTFLFFRFLTLINGKFSDFFFFSYRIKLLFCMETLLKDFDGITKREKFRKKIYSRRKYFLYRDY